MKSPVKYFAALIILILSIVVVALPPKTQAVIPGNSGKIVFSEGNGNSTEIYTINADGSGVIRLTNNNVADVEPSWSPDGTLIAFHSTRDDPNGEIYIMNADGSDVRRRTSNSNIDREPQWSPDGNIISFISNRDQPTYEIYKMTIFGTEVTRLTNNTAAEGTASWSPDGTKLLFETNRDSGNLEIYTMDTAGNNPVRITTNAALDFWPAWSPDGTNILFSSTRDEPTFYETYTMNANGTGVIRLTNNTIYDGQGVWSPDGTKIALTSFDGDSYEIYTMSPSDGSNRTQLTSTGGYHNPPSWQAYTPVSGPTLAEVNQSITLTATASTCTNPNGWVWTTNDGGPSSISNTINLNWSTPGTKSVAVTNSGCGVLTGTHTVVVFDRLPVHRFYNVHQGVHFYTSNQAEATNVYNTMSGTYRYEGVANYAVDRQVAGTVPVHRFYNVHQGVHFYTSNQAEATYVYNNYGGTYRYEGVAHYSYTSQVAGTVPVHRFYNVHQGVHFYTSNQAEATYVYNNYGGTYRYEGVAHYNFSNAN